MISFEVTKGERCLIEDIAARGERLARKHGIKINRLEVMMDITACHCNGCPLNLGRFLAYTESDFGHDLFGINRHLNRDTGKLENCFRPRCARPASEGRAA